MTKKGYLYSTHHLYNRPIDRAINSENYNKFLKLAKIVLVNHENMTADLVYLGSVGSEFKVPIAQGFVGNRSFMGGMPEEGDICIVGSNQSGSLSIPLIIAFFPANYSTGLRNDILDVPSYLKDSLSEYRPKMKKIYEGEVFGSSTYGSEIHLDKNVSISNSMLSEIFLKSSDQSIHFNAVSTYINSSGVRNLSGLIKRNALIDDPDYRFPNAEFPVYYDSEGNPNYVPNLTSTITALNPYGRETVDDDNPAFIEHRTEVQEYSDPILPVTESNSGIDIDSFYKNKPDGTTSQPLVVQVLGTLTGNDPVGDKDRYGVILKPKIFSDPVSFKGQVQEQPCVADSGMNEAITLAAAYTLKFPNTSTAFYVNKQGKYFANIGASSSIDPMGSGESSEICLQGHSKIYMGKNVTSNRSMSLNTAGGIYTNWGFDSEKTRSWDATFRKAVSWNILGADKDGNSLIIRVTGDSRESVIGSKFSEITSDEFKIIQGKSEERVLGKKVSQCVGDVNTTIGGKYVEMSIGHYNQTLSSGISRTIVAPDSTSGSIAAESTKIRLGDSELNISLGSRKEKITLGNHNVDIGVGNKTATIAAGNYSVRCNAGSIDITTRAGNVSLKTTAGTMVVEGSISVTIKSAIKVTLDAPLVDVGKSGQMGGIVTGGPSGNHRDYITGAPLIGSLTTKANSF